MKTWSVIAQIASCARIVRRSPRIRASSALIGLMFCGLAMAQAVLTVDLPAQALDAAIHALARQAGVQVVFAAPIAAGKEAAALKGKYSVRQALEALLASSGLVFKEPSDKVFTIETASGALSAVLPVVHTSAARESESGAVTGYDARCSVTGTKTDTELACTPQAISVVGAAQIADQSALSVAEALRHTGGIFTEYRSASNLHEEMVLRGFLYAPSYMNGLQYGSGSLGQIDPYLLGRVEVLRGPTSVLYGQASPGGIVNLVSKQPDAAARQEVMDGFGTASVRYA